MDFRRPPIRAALCAACLCATGSLALAQDGVRGQAGGARIYEEQLRVQFDQQSLESRERGVDGGGWFNYAFFHYQDNEQRTRTDSQYQFRPWGSLDYESVHRAYVRGLLDYDAWHDHDNPDGGGDDKHFKVERAWYQFDFGQYLRNQTHQTPPVDLSVKVGREYTTLGTGLVLAMPMDMIQLDAAAGNWQFTALIGQSIHDTTNLDNSSPVSDHQDRCFFGGQVTYLGFSHDRPFVYYLENQDHTRPHPNDPDQSFDYTSRYVGGGSTGTLWLPDLRYQTEGAAEFGRTYSVGQTTDTDPIYAWVVDAQIDYYFQVKTHPNVGVEYLHGSGDSDRGSATSTVNGNRAGTPDNAFNGFGYRDTGIAFAPSYSNLSIYSAGGGFFPLEQVPLLRKMEWGTRAYFYQKANASGGISDSSATESSPWVGWEWDVYCNWRITSDLTWTVRYGLFEPGSAFASDQSRNFLLTSVTYSF